MVKERNMGKTCINLFDGRYDYTCNSTVRITLWWYYDLYITVWWGFYALSDSVFFQGIFLKGSWRQASDRRGTNSCSSSVYYLLYAQVLLFAFIVSDIKNVINNKKTWIKFCAIVSDIKNVINNKKTCIKFCVSESVWQLFGVPI